MWKTASFTWNKTTRREKTTVQTTKTIGRIKNIIYPHKWSRINMKWPALPIYCLITEQIPIRWKIICSIVIYHLGSKYKEREYGLCRSDPIKTERLVWKNLLKRTNDRIKPRKLWNKWKQRKIMWTTEVSRETEQLTTKIYCCPTTAEM